MILVLLKRLFPFALRCRKFQASIVAFPFHPLMPFLFIVPSRSCSAPPALIAFSPSLDTIAEVYFYQALIFFFFTFFFERSPNISCG